MISAEEAENIARARAEELNWGLMEPIMIRERRSPEGAREYYVVSNPAVLGTKSRFTIDAETGKITDEGYLPR